jgi:hypothetical protein
MTQIFAAFQTQEQSTCCNNFYPAWVRKQIQPPSSPSWCEHRKKEKNEWELVGEEEIEGGDEVKGDDVHVHARYHWRSPPQRSNLVPPEAAALEAEATRASSETSRRTPWRGLPHLQQRKATGGDSHLQKAEEWAAHDFFSLRTHDEDESNFLSKEWPGRLQSIGCTADGRRALDIEWLFRYARDRPRWTRTTIGRCCFPHEVATLASQLGL